MAEHPELVPLTDEQVEQQRTALVDKRERLLQAVKSAEQNQDPDELRVADEMDLSSAGYDQAFEYRLRDRDATLLKKIDKALRRIERADVLLVVTSPEVSSAVSTVEWVQSAGRVSSIEPALAETEIGLVFVESPVGVSFPRSTVADRKSTRLNSSHT